MRSHAFSCRKSIENTIFRIATLSIQRRFEAPDLSTKDDDSTFYDTAFETLEEIVKKAWPYLYKDAEVKKNALTIFEQLISLASSEMVQKTAEKMKDTCEWLKISAEEICAQIEDCLWNVTDLLVLRLFELKKSIPYEIVSYAIAVHITQEVTLASPEGWSFCVFLVVVVVVVIAGYRTCSKGNASLKGDVVPF
uniref:Uncharacterized protein n=1 Tax=Caenorhabditis japonica TaxID=281687 RepID=A0A8R1ENK6_CAEJA